MDIQELRRHISEATERRSPAVVSRQTDEQREGGWCRSVQDSCRHPPVKQEIVYLNRMVCPGERSGGEHYFLRKWERQNTPPSVEVYPDGRCVCQVCGKELAPANNVHMDRGTTTSAPPVSIPYGSGE